VVREALSVGAAKIIGAAIVEALLLGGVMPPAEEAAALAADAQKQLVDYRTCEASFHSRLAPPPGAGDDERAIYRRRVGIERAVACAFPRRDAARVAGGFALDVDFDRPAEFVDNLLQDLPMRWLEPYLHLMAGHARLCDGNANAARGHLAAAAKGGNALVRAAADYLLATSAPPCSPSP
jgi:hypothetical protein